MKEILPKPTGILKNGFCQVPFLLHHETHHFKHVVVLRELVLVDVLFTPTPFQSLPFLNWSTRTNDELRLLSRSTKMPYAAKNPKLFDGDLGLQKSSLKLVEDKFDVTNVAVYFGEENALPQDPIFDSRTRKNRFQFFACLTGCRNNLKKHLTRIIYSSHNIMERLLWRSKKSMMCHSITFCIIHAGANH
jgi:hypothetical protein